MVQRPQEPPESIEIREFLGIKNTVNPERLTPGQLEAARNVDIDDSGQPRRRRGYVRRAEGAFHSLFTNEAGITFVVRDGVLSRVFPDYTFQALGEGGSAPISFMDLAGITYFSSLEVSGRILPDLTIAPWGESGGGSTWLSPVVNPTATLGEVAGKLQARPPMAEWLTHLNGRIYLANDRTLWATELFQFDRVDPTRTFLQFESRITGLIRCGEGFYVGTEASVFYLSGTFGEMRRRDVVDSGCIPGSMVAAIGDLALVAGEPALQHRDAVLFMTEQGLIVGFNNGFCRNITANETLFPKALRVAPMLRAQDGMHQYIAVAESGGTPASRAQIGSYVDVEIRRAVRPS